MDWAVPDGPQRGSHQRVGTIPRAGIHDTQLVTVPLEKLAGILKIALVLRL